jgi:hypothetical protein
MKTNITKLLVVLSLVMLAVSGANANLIVNGSFENPEFTSTGSTWGTYSSIPGWTATTDSIEIGTGETYGVTGFHGKNVMELDAYKNVVVNQSLASAGGSYSLSFLYAKRSSVGADSCLFDVYWNNILLGNFSPTSTSMTPFSVSVVGLANNVLEFRGMGTSDSYGALIDDVRLMGTENAPVVGVVPEPSTWVAGALMVLPFGLHGLRRLRSRKLVS